METNIEVLTESAKEYGLQINEQKTKVLHIRGTEKVEEVGNCRVTEILNYLGIQLGGNGRDKFIAEKRVWLQKAIKQSNKIILQIKKSYDEVTVGKAI